MRVKVSECAAMYYVRGQLIFDDYLDHRQYALTGNSQAVLRYFADWRELTSIAEHDPELGAIAEHLLDAGLLIEEHSATHLREEELLSRWHGFGEAARHFHFSARAHAETRFLTEREDRERIAEKVALTPPPPPFKTYGGRTRIPIPDGTPGGIDWPRPGLVEALYSRRSVRRFAPEPPTILQIGALLQIANGIIGYVEDPDVGRSALKTSPSAGARDPIELYLHVTRVAGLAPGIYHFAPSNSTLELLGPPVERAELAAAAGGQPWLVDAPALLIYTAVLERTRWRYPTLRAYRDVLVELGHVSQTVLLTATSMGLGAVTATAVCDEHLERMLGLDPAAEPTLAVTALGRPAA